MNQSSHRLRPNRCKFLRSLDSKPKWLAMSEGISHSIRSTSNSRSSNRKKRSCIAMDGLTRVPAWFEFRSIEPCNSWWKDKMLRNRFLQFVTAGILLLTCVRSVSNAATAVQAVLQEVGIDQKLNTSVPLNLEFRDE